MKKYILQTAALTLATVLGANGVQASAAYWQNLGDVINYGVNKETGVVSGQNAGGDAAEIEAILGSGLALPTYADARAVSDRILLANTADFTANPLGIAPADTFTARLTLLAKDIDPALGDGDKIQPELTFYRTRINGDVAFSVALPAFEAVLGGAALDATAGGSMVGRLSTLRDSLKAGVDLSQSVTDVRAKITNAALASADLEMDALNTVLGGANSAKQRADALAGALGGADATVALAALRAKITNVAGANAIAEAEAQRVDLLARVNAVLPAGGNIAIAGSPALAAGASLAEILAKF